MATTDVERLVVSLEASITKFDRTMQKALDITNNTMRKIEQRQATAIQKLNAGWSGMQRGIATAFASAAALRGAQQLLDASTRIENALKVAGLEGERLSEVYDSLFQSAQRNAAPLESLVTLYGRVALVQKDLGASTEEMLGFTDNVAVALRVAGTDAQSASGALMQLSQAMGSGIVRAEEFNSILEGALPIAQAAAAGLAEAGGSVAKLRALVVDGKVSSEAFFRAFEAGSVVLQEKVANAELTVSQQFVRLQNVLIDTAGKFDDATGASARTGQGLNNLATFIERVGTVIAANKENIGWFIDKLGEATSNLPVVNTFLNSMEQLNLSFDVELQTKAAEQEAARFAAETEAMFAEAISGATSMLDEWRAGWGETLPPELQASVESLIEQVKAGGEEAKTAQAALIELGGTGTPFTEALGHLNTLVAELQRVRGEANATAAAVAQAARPDVSGTPQSYAGQEGTGPTPVAPKTVSLKDYKLPSTSSGGSGAGGSKRDQYAAAVAAQQARIDALTRETALQAQLNPLVNDYGFAVEKLRAQIELENAAKEQGLALDEPRRQQIDELSSGYARATAEAARLAEAQDQVRQSAEDLANAGRQALDTIIDGFLEGRDAGEVLNSMVKDLSRNLLKMGIDLIGGGVKAGGFNPLGFLGGLFGFASGTANTGGQRGQPRGIVHGQEAVIPLPNGGRVPVDIRMPSLPSAGSGGGEIKVSAEMQVIDGNLVPVVTRISGQVAGQQVKAYDRQLPNRLQDINMRRG